MSYQRFLNRKALTLPAGISRSAALTSRNTMEKNAMANRNFTINATAQLSIEASLP